jgi:hypothetical protein
MEEERFWGMKRSSSLTGMIVRIGLAVAAIVSSGVLAWFLISGHDSASAAHLVTNAQTPSPTPSVPLKPGPVNKTWYFAEGRVGKSFREYLTIGNASNTACSVNIQYNYTLDGSSTPANKMVSVNVPPASRLTESVNNDLGIPDSSGTAASLAAIVTVNSTATPNCQGVVAERPMYFTNFHGIASGTDVLGSTTLSKTYYFADVPSGSVGGSSYTSYITILNPNNVAANIKVVYPAPFSALTQSLKVQPNSRGTIAPSQAQYTGHMPAIVTSDQPVMVERPTYFFNVNNANGAYDVVGVPNLANDWLFAEGYTGSGFQEYLTLANLSTSSPTATAKVTITLKSTTGATQQFSLTLNNNMQNMWNVNANNNFQGSSPQVSAEVTSTGANIIVQREIYFSYKHSLTAPAIGGTDVIGQVGPASHNTYSFAEGYTNTGYNTWLTIQNPTTSQETIYVTLVNGLSQTYSESFQVTPHSRYTQDITALVQTAFHASTSSQANSVSMTVQTLNGAPFVAERPMYFNTNGVTNFGVQGGTDILGYIGG